MTDTIRKTHRSSINHRSTPSDAPPNRASRLLEAAKVKVESKGKWGRRVLNLLNIGCEVKPLNGQKTFLSQASRRNFNAVSVMRALVQDTGKPPTSQVPDKLQAARVRRNLVKHDELRQALKNLRRDIGDTRNKTLKQQEFAKFVDKLRLGFEHTVREVSKISEKTADPKRRAGKGQETLEKALREAWFAAADETSRSPPEESILAQLSRIDGKSPPSIEPSPPSVALLSDVKGESMDTGNRYTRTPPPSPRIETKSKEPTDGTKAKRRQLQRLHDGHKRSQSLAERQAKAAPSTEKPRSPQKGDRYGAVERRLQSTGLIDPRIVEDLMRGAFQRQEKPISEKQLQEHLANFIGAPARLHDYILGRLITAQKEKVDLDGLMQTIGGSPRLWSFGDLPAVTKDFLAAYAIHDIARQFAHCKDDKAFRTAVIEGLQNSELTTVAAQDFMKHAKDLPLAGRSAVVRQVIADRAKGKI